MRPDDSDRDQYWLTGVTHAVSPYADTSAVDASSDVAALLNAIEASDADLKLLRAVSVGAFLAEHARDEGITNCTVRKRWQRLRRKFAAARHVFRVSTPDSTQGG